MINKTTNYQIKKPTPDEFYDIAINNDNADIIDGALKAQADAIATKQPTITGGASTIATANLTTSKALISGVTGKVSTADVTATELSYVKGVTGAIQTQINTKASTSSVSAHTGDAVAHITNAERTAWNALPTDQNLGAHVNNNDIHVTSAKQSAWNAKATPADISTHAGLTTHISANERTAWNGKTDDTTANAHKNDTVPHASATEKGKWNGAYTHISDAEKHLTGAERTAWNLKADGSDLTAHTGDTVKHVTAGDKTNWNGKVDASQGTTNKNKFVGTDGTGKITVFKDISDADVPASISRASALTTHAGLNIHITTAERTAWNAKETTSGSQTKATTALTDAKAYTDGKVKTNVPTGAVFTDTPTDISGKVDKVTGKQLSTEDYTSTEKNKLSGLENYTHPASHPASMITESTTKRFVTDAEKTAWNAKADNTALTSHADNTSHITAGERTGWNGKTDDTAINSHKGDGNIHVTSALKTGWSKAITDLGTHTGDSSHISGAERTAWNNKVNILAGPTNKNKFVKTDNDGNIKTFDTINAGDVPPHSAELLTSGTIPSGRIGADIARGSDITTHAGLTTHITGSERTAWNGKVDKVTGKQLSTEDYTTVEKTKLSGIATGANNYVLPAEVLKNTAQSFNTTQQNQVKTNLDILKTWVGLEANKGTDANTIYFCLE